MQIFLPPPRKKTKWNLLIRFPVIWTLYLGGYAFSYQYLQGEYRPECGESGRTTRWLSSLREGVFWDGRKDPMYELAWVHLSEKDFILPRVFGIGDDPCPPDMRTDLTLEEWEIGYAQYMKDRERLWMQES